MLSASLVTILIRQLEDSTNVPSFLFLLPKIKKKKKDTLTLIVYHMPCL